MEKSRTTIYIEKSLWQRFKEITVRDRIPMSRQVEELINDWVQKKDPGNPQRPLTAFAEGHDDFIKAQTPGKVEQLKAYADKRRGQLKNKFILEQLQYIKDGKKRVREAKRITDLLTKQGVKILY